MQKKYKCEFCGRLFDRSSDCLAHETVHREVSFGKADKNVLGKGENFSRARKKQQ